MSNEMSNEIKVTYIKKTYNKDEHYQDQREKCLELAKTLTEWITIELLANQLNVSYIVAYNKIKLMNLYGFLKIRKKPNPYLKCKFCREYMVKENIE